MTWPVVTFNERLSSWVCTFIESKVALFRILDSAINISFIGMNY